MRPKQNNNHAEGNGNGIFHKRLRRQERALVRQEERAQRTPSEQIAELDRRGVKATRERVRLASLAIAQLNGGTENLPAKPKPKKRNPKQ
jgi:hypothetical protein